LPRAWLRLIAAFAVFFAGPAFAAQPAELTVFAAASLKNALDAVDAAYARTPGAAPVRAAYAASSTLARQIEQGAPADVYISADSAWMDYVAERGLVRAGSRADLLANHLALIAPKDSAARLAIRPNFALAAALGRGRLAMAGLDVPAGRYGKAALESLGVWDQISAKTAYGENVRAALNFVARGEAPFGIVYDTDALVEPGVRIVALFPDDSHPPIVYPAAIVAASKSPAAAGYLAFLKGPTATAIFRRFGFRPAG